MYEDLLLAIAIIFAFIFAIRYLDKKGHLKKYSLSAYGPFLMWRTEGGKNLIEKLSRPKRFWEIYGAAAKVICLIVMSLMMALLIWEATIVSRIPAESAPGPEMILGIPGINPIIPIWYGILGLVVAIIVHEFAHGILTRVGKMGIKSLGILLLIVPLGAFVEPDEEELAKTTKKRRMNVYAVGPATNIILALVCAILFSSVLMSGVTPIRDNPIVVNLASDGPGDMADLAFGAQIIEIADKDISTLDDFTYLDAPAAGTVVNITYYFKGDLHNSTAFSGVMLTQVSKGYPADQAGLKAGMLIYSLNDTGVRNDNDLRSILMQTKGGQTVNITVMAYNEASEVYEVVPDIKTITLMSREEYYQQIDPSQIGPDFKDYGFMGINSAYMGVSVNTPGVIIDRLARPYEGADTVDKVISSSLGYIALPFLGLAPIQSPITDLFEPTGILAGFSGEAFWITANCLYWIFWINLMVGMTNVLPAVPLDGGFLFRDGLESIVKRLKRNATDADKERYVGMITRTLAFFVLFLILWQFIGPRLLG